MVDATRHYKEMVGEEILPGVPKIYMKEKRSISMAITRGRTNTIDPKPRKPEWENPYRCKLCLAKSQTSRHYIVECLMTENVFVNKEDRISSWQLLKTIKGDRNDIINLGYKIKRILNLLKMEESA